MPDFGSQEYWDERFTKDGTPFEWLQSPQFLHGAASHWMKPENLRRAEVLHIGCGTSDLGHLLCKSVLEPRQIHNVDFSQAAIDAGSRREKELLEARDSDLKGTENRHDGVFTPEPLQAMRWSCLDLLSLHSTLDLMEQQEEAGKLFDLILDKGTSDNIAMAPIASIRLPYPLSVNGWTRGILQSGVTQTADIHPLHVLAVHLAALARPKTGKWISISYSEDRFPFLPPYPHTVSHGLLPDSVIKAGFPHPSQLWRLETKERIDLPDEGETLAHRKKRLSSGVVHRPKLSHWLYVLVRTQTLVTY